MCLRNFHVLSIKSKFGIVPLSETRGRDNYCVTYHYVVEVLYPEVYLHNFVSILNNPLSQVLD